MAYALETAALRFFVHAAMAAHSTTPEREAHLTTPFSAKCVQDRLAGFLITNRANGCEYNWIEEAAQVFQTTASFHKGVFA
jgi:hypothetical protein